MVSGPIPRRSPAAGIPSLAPLRRQDDALRVRIDHVAALFEAGRSTDGPGNVVESRVTVHLVHLGQAPVHPSRFALFEALVILGRPNDPGRHDDQQLDATPFDAVVTEEMPEDGDVR